MTYNIINVDTISSSAYISFDDACALSGEYWEKLPEHCFIYDWEFKKDQDPYSKIHIDNFDWCGVGSGKSFEMFVNKIVPHIKGRAEITFTWEDGDTTYYLLKDGKLLQAKLQVVEEKKKPLWHHADGWLNINGQGDNFHSYPLAEENLPRLKSLLRKAVSREAKDGEVTRTITYSFTDDISPDLMFAATYENGKLFQIHLDGPGKDVGCATLFIQSSEVEDLINQLDVYKEKTPMKAYDVFINTKVRRYDSNRTGIIVANRLRQGDEIVAVEWDDDQTVEAFNVTDLVVLDTDDRVL